MCKEVDVGRVFYAYGGEERRAKREAQLRPGRFVPEAKDHARLMPRLREAPRR